MATTLEIATELPASQDWRDILVELLPAQGSWSEEEYLVLTDHRSRLVEFTDGFLEVLPMPTDKHQSVLKFLFLAFFGFVEPRVESNLPRYVCEFAKASIVSPIFSS